MRGPQSNVVPDARAHVPAIGERGCPGAASAATRGHVQRAADPYARATMCECCRAAPAVRRRGPRSAGAVRAAGRARARRADPLAALLARTHAVAKEVRAIRGLPLKQPIADEVVDRDELRARLVKLAADHKTATETARRGRRARALGPGPARHRLRAALMIDLMTDQIAGYYDPDTKKLTISRAPADADPTWAEMVLAHELDHGLQDQSFDLKKFEDLPDGEGDAALARHALVEGDGIALMIEVMLAREHIARAVGEPERRATRSSRRWPRRPATSLDKAPLAMREADAVPVSRGLRVRRGAAAAPAVERGRRRVQAAAALDRADPPSREVPRRREAGRRSTAARACRRCPATRSRTRPCGASSASSCSCARTASPTIAATEAAAGWGGDRVVLLAKPATIAPSTRSALARFEWDTEVDAIEAHDAAVRRSTTRRRRARSSTTTTRTRWLALDGTVALSSGAAPRS